MTVKEYLLIRAKKNTKTDILMPILTLCNISILVFSYYYTIRLAFYINIIWTTISLISFINYFRNRKKYINEINALPNLPLSEMFDGILIDMFEGRITEEDANRKIEYQLNIIEGQVQFAQNMKSGDESNG
jgi:hypothetical protein